MVSVISVLFDVLIVFEIWFVSMVVMLCDVLCVCLIILLCVVYSVIVLILSVVSDISVFNVLMMSGLCLVQLVIFLIEVNVGMFVFVWDVGCNGVGVG